MIASSLSSIGCHRCLIKLVALDYPLSSITASSSSMMTMMSGHRQLSLPLWPSFSFSQISSLFSHSLKSLAFSLILSFYLGLIERKWIARLLELELSQIISVPLKIIVKLTGVLSQMN
jgi:hypothetical protein